MKMKKQISLISILSLIICVHSFAQDIHFSQFNESPLTLNPATTGAFKGEQRAIMNYKNQWTSIPDAYKTVSASFDSKILKRKIKTGYLAMGLVFFNDKAGEAQLSTTQANLSIAYHATINSNNILTGAIQGGFSQKNIDINSLEWDEQWEQGMGYNSDKSSGETTDLKNFSYGDYSAGLLWSYFSEEAYMTSNNALKATFGMAMLHINEPKYSFYDIKEDKLNPKFAIHGNAFIGIRNTNLAIIPSALFLRQKKQQEISIGSMFRYMLKEESKYTKLVNGLAISFGGHYRLKDAFILESQFEIANWALGISYDINTSDFKTASNGRGGIELSLRYVNPNPFRKNEKFY